MRIGIVREGDNIATIKDYSYINDKGEISHFLSEIEVIKHELINLWLEWHGENEDEVVE